MYSIQDWAGNLMSFGTFKNVYDAEDFLMIMLDKDYDTDRGEYYIILTKRGI